MYCVIKKITRNVQDEQGQALLIMVLVMVVALTVGLSVASRTVTNLRTTIEEENSQRAFSAAEAGVEQALKTGQSVSVAQSLGNNAQIKNVSIQQIQGTEFLINGGNSIPQDDGADIWLSDYPNYTNQWPTGGNGNITLYWGSPNDTCSSSFLTNTMSAIEIVVVTGSRVNPLTTRYGFDPCTLRAANNHFTQPLSGTYSVSGKTFSNSASITVPAGSGIIARIIPLYAGVVIGVKACDSSGGNCLSLPAQGKNIDATGTSGETVRKIRVFQGYPQLPSEFFPYILFQTKS